MDIPIGRSESSPIDPTSGKVGKNNIGDIKGLEDAFMAPVSYETPLEVSNKLAQTTTADGKVIDKTLEDPGVVKAILSDPLGNISGENPTSHTPR